MSKLKKPSARRKIAQRMKKKKKIAKCAKEKLLRKKLV